MDARSLRRVHPIGRIDGGYEAGRRHRHVAGCCLMTMRILPAAIQVEWQATADADLRGRYAFASAQLLPFPARS